MKIRLIALILCGLLLAAPTMRTADAETAEELRHVEDAAPYEEEPEDYIAEDEAITAAEPAASPSPAAAAAPSPAGGGTELAPEDQDAPEVWREDVPLRAELQAALLAVCEETGVDPLLMLGLIETESGFREDAVSPSKDYGLCQLHYLYFDPGMTPEENIRAGVGLLARHMGTYRTTEAALTAYHVGHDDGTRYYASVVLERARAWGYGG